MNHILWFLTNLTNEKDVPDYYEYENTVKIHKHILIDTHL